MYFKVTKADAIRHILSNISSSADKIYGRIAFPHTAVTS
jgi:hypothetical protein